jgi:riboflavin synthase
MFTGLVSDVGEVLQVELRGELRRLRIACNYPAETIAEGASIACTWFDVDVAAETLARTNARDWRIGTRLNLERSLRIGDELGGHIVTGHVDGIATIAAIDAFDGMKRYRIDAPKALARFIAEKGSVSLDGTSLTVNEVDGHSFSILLIPHTLAVTSWGEKQVGDALNIEVDLMARYAARLVEAK